MTDCGMKLQTRRLAGRLVELEPYEDCIRSEVQRALDCDPEAWNVFAVSGRGEHFASWWSRLTDAMEKGTWIAYAVRDRASGRVVGTSSFLNLKPERQTAEIGGTFFEPAARSGYANPESKLLMLSHAFECGARRVELLTDLRNVRSQAAIAKLGAVREGVLRRDRITWTGHVRDSVIYSVTDLDWPAVRERLRQRLAALG
jgi:N-acetyltransferase